jgi:hypothetical protein
MSDTIRILPISKDRAGIQVNRAIVPNEDNQTGVSTPTISTLEARAAGKARLATG